MVYIAYACLAVPLALLIPLVSSGPARRIVAFTLVGATIAVSAAEINGVIRTLFGMAAVSISLDVAPIVEEIMKAVPVLLYAIFGSDRREDVLPLGMATGIGFAILENSYLMISMLANGGSVSLEWALVRGLSSSLMHGLCTAAVAFGITYVRKKRKLFYTGTFALLTAAITFHSAFNVLTLAPSPYDWAGLAMPMLTYLAFHALSRIRRKPTKLV